MKKLFLLILFIHTLYADVKSITVGSELSDSIEYQKIKYYKVKVLGGQTVHVTIDKLKADADIYLKIGKRPVPSSYDCKSSTLEDLGESCTLSVTEDSQVYIGIYGFNATPYRLKTLVETYGKEGKHKVLVTPYSENSTSVIIHPKDWNLNPTPIVFFAPGFQSRSYVEYLTLLKYIASQGYSVIYVRDSADIQERDVEERFKKFTAIVDKFSNNLDTTKIGMLGYSSGGGISFSLMRKIMKKGWGKDGRFMFLIEPWFAFGMNKHDMRKITNTNVVILQFGEKGSSSDPRISLVEYKLLTGIEDDKKDYQIVLEENATHAYPLGSRPISKMQGMLKPLDALMKYSFKNDTLSKHVALEKGSDTPYLDNKLKFKLIKYYNEGGCKGEHPLQKSMIKKYTIDYCDTPER